MATLQDVAQSRRTIAWMALAFVALHNAEEAFALRTYFPRLAGLLPEPFAEVVGGLSYPAMLQALVVVTVVVACVALATAIRPQSPGALWALLTLEAVMAINAIAHVASALFVFRGYGPGLLTALLFNAPFAAWCFRRAHRERWISVPAMRATVPAAIVLHGPVLACGLWLVGAVAN